MGCGFCSVPLADSQGAPTVEIRWSTKHEHWGPHVNDGGNLSGDKRICPGAIMDMPGLSELVFGKQPDDIMAGETKRIAAGYAADPEVRRQAASGGIITALLTGLLEDNAIDVAYCVAGKNPRSGHGMLLRDTEGLRIAAGSHYHPVAFGSALAELVESKERFAFVGLPCEVSAMRKMMAQKPDLANRCVVIIGLFCGGINRFSGIARYLEHFGGPPGAVEEIDYRSGTWPGEIQITSGGGTAIRTVPRIRNNTRWNILRYMISFQGYWMLPRCRICPDQIADFADIAVGDPHLPRFKSQNTQGYSAVVARTANGLNIVQAATDAQRIVLEPLSRDELIASQGYTIENRRYALVYARVAKRLGFEPPRLRVYTGLEKPRNAHQNIYAFVDMAKIRYRHLKWLRPFYLPLQIFEYLFLTLSPRFVLARLRKLTFNK